MENDGFTLGTQRKPISKNDLNEVEDLIKVFYREGNVTNLEFFKCIEKLKIEEKDFTLSISAFESKVNLVSKFPTRLLTDLAKLERGTSITKKEVEEGKIPVIAGGKKQAYFHNVANRVSRSITISSSGAYAGYVSFHEEPIFASDCFTVISREKTLDQKFLFYLLKSKQELIYKMQTGGGQPHVYAKNFHDFEIPFPTFEIQKEIVDELDGYQRIINGCSQVIDNYKPFIDFDEAWELVELRELVNVNNGNTLTSFDEEGDLAGIKVSDMNLHENQVEIITSNKKVNRTRFNQKHILPVGSIVFPKRGAAIATNKKRITRIPCVIDNNCMGLTIKSKRVLAEYLFNFLCSFDLTTISKSAGIPLINNPDIFGVKIPLPTIDLQSQISNNIKKERELISGNKKLVDLYQRKIKDKLSKIWGE